MRFNEGIMYVRLTFGPFCQDLSLWFIFNTIRYLGKQGQRIPETANEIMTFDGKRCT